jgi:hypothetical protein
LNLALRPSLRDDLVSSCPAACRFNSDMQIVFGACLFALFLVLSILSVFCFSRNWLRSGYFGALVVFLVFFGADFSFIPGLLLGEKGDWSLRYFSAPAVVTLFFTNPILPGLGVLFAGLFCLDCYMRERSRAWLFLAALLFVALIEVKMLIAVQLMCSLALAAVVYLIIFSNADYSKSADALPLGRFPWLAGCCSRTGAVHRSSQNSSHGFMSRMRCRPLD